MEVDRTECGPTIKEFTFQMTLNLQPQVATVIMLKIDALYQRVFRHLF